MKRKSHRNIVEATATRCIDSPVGPLFLAATDGGLTHVLFTIEGRTFPAVVPGSGAAARIVERASRQLSEYFAGKRRAFDIPLAAEGTEFQRSAWRALVEIPYGETISYGELARRLNRPRAVRAVGSANGANPISIVVPCHRVVGADGSLTGFGGGLDNKQRLLAHEGSSAASQGRLPLSPPAARRREPS